MGITKLSICKEISERNSIPLSLVENSVDSFLEILKNKIASGESIQIRGFGSFRRVLKKKRNVWDPIQRITKISEEKFKIHFKSGKEWTELTHSQLSQKSKGD
ncbi:MAG: HU family DNA-binding protein [Leptospiraceae bacterium]|nr:HU family DNA-binding protein [Leptospiraceae bacterium]MCK6381185.1 HU family DNA-binding protein [Leptospiraceae bacterium]NUM40459.1 HU family DNA-binding protein [Leptospiraceae bacterium]